MWHRAQCSSSLGHTRTEPTISTQRSAFPRNAVSAAALGGAAPNGSGLDGALERSSAATIASSMSLRGSTTVCRAAEDLTEAEREAQLGTARRNAELLETEYDLVFLHVPQECVALTRSPYHRRGFGGVILRARRRDARVVGLIPSSPAAP